MKKVKLLGCLLMLSLLIGNAQAQFLSAKRTSPRPQSPPAVSGKAGELLWDNRGVNHVDTGIISMQLGALAPGQNLVNTADDFIVSSGQIWAIDSIYAEGFPSQQQLPDSYAVAIYEDDAGIPGSLIYQETMIPPNGISPTNVRLPLSEAVVLQPDRYWLSVYAVYSNGFDINLTRWNWATGNVSIESEYYLQDESGAFGGFEWLPASFFNIAEQSAFFAIYGTEGGDDADPNPPENFTAYSDFNTPNEMTLTWTDPSTYRDGANLTNFQIMISRDGEVVDSTDMGLETYIDSLLTDGQLYDYRIWARDSVDSVSAPVLASWIAGGSPIPSAPENLACESDSVQAVITWTDPATQVDGTPLDDLDSIRVYRSGTLIATVAPGQETFTDVPPPRVVYSYTVTAVDNETPKNESAPSNSDECFTGPVPTFLIWVGPTAGGGAIASGDSLLSALEANGEDALLTNNLFELGQDLSVYEGIFVVLGIFPNNHTIGFDDPEGPALENFLANGGSLFVEGGDCFNFDPEASNDTGYNIRPWFDLNDGPDGLSDMFGVEGVNDLSAFTFAYSGDNSFMDELQPGASTPVWRNDSNTDISGVFNINFGGRAIATVPAFGGFVNSTDQLNMERRLAEAGPTSQDIVFDPEKPVVERRPQFNFQKKVVFPDQKPQRSHQKEFLKVTPNGVEILANNKAELMAAYLEFFRAPEGPPMIDVHPAAIIDSVFANGASESIISVANIGNTLTESLEFTAVVNPAEAWINISPTADSLGANDTTLITVSLNAAGLLPGIFTTTIEITSNDPDNGFISIPVTMEVTEAPVVDFSPDSLSFDLEPVSSDSLPIQIRNSGLGTLAFSLTPLTQFSGGAAKQMKTQPSRVNEDIFTPEFKRAIAQRTKYQSSGNATVETQQPLNKSTGIPTEIDGEEIFGSTEEDFTGSLRDRSNLFRITKSVILTEHKMYLNIPEDIELYFYVFEGDSLLGNFTKIHEVFFPTSGTGEGFYSSGKISVAMNAGKYYVLGASWGEGQVTYYRGSESVPLETSFGALETGVPSSLAGFPPGIDGRNEFEGFPPYFSSVTTAIPLSANPASGTVAGGDSVEVWVTANSSGLLGGAYRGAIQIDNNDPLNPDTAMAVNFNVSSSPVIQIFPDSLTFDTLLVGGQQNRTFTVSNIGTADLAISSIAASNPSFLVDTTSFTLPPLTSETVTATFAPLVSGSFNEVLEISSNDPQSPLDSLRLLAVANDPPEIVLSPTNFEETLAPGNSASDTLQIINRGEGELRFTITLEDATPLANITSVGGDAVKNAKIMAIGNPVPLSMLNHREVNLAAKAGLPDSELSPISHSNNGPAPPVISGEEVFGSQQSAFGPFGERGRGNFYSVTETTTLLEHRLYLDIIEETEVWFIIAESDSRIGIYDVISAANVSPRGPGEGWYSSGPVQVTLEAGRYYMIYTQWDSPATYFIEENISPYPVQASFGELIGGVGWTVAGNPDYSVPPPATQMVSPLAFGDAVAYYQTIVTGVGTDWIDVSLTEGIVPPQSSLDVVISYDPLDLPGGDYFADVVVNSNDPINPEVRAEVQMTVIGLPEIAADSVVFEAPVFVNDTDTADLWIRNNGNGVLNISSISSDNPVFAAVLNDSTVAAFDSLAVPITFSPLELDVQTGTLTITSNDSMNPAVTVSVSGTAIAGPGMALEPDSIMESLRFGDSLDVPVIISNDGEAALTWAVVLGSDSPGKRSFGALSEGAGADGGSAERECCDDGPSEGSPQSQFIVSQETIVQDGGFEAGSPNPFWNEQSAVFGTPLCTLPVCGAGQGTGPHSGEWWCWLGGSSIGETGSVDQDLVIPFSRAAVLRFWLEIPSTNTTGFMEVQIDDNVIFRVTEADGQAYGEYLEVLVDITEYADGETHNLKFFTVTDPTEEGALNFFIDDVSIEIAGSPFLSVLGETSGTIGSGDVSGFIVRLFALENDTTFSATLVINSNDPLNRRVDIPVYLTVSDSVVGIQDMEALPKTYSVSPNYPNPFNPTTTINYDIPKASDVSLIVYNVLGQKVRTLVNNRRDPGRYNVVWDATNDAGSQVASGIYIYRFQAGEFSQIRKMILLK